LTTKERTAECKAPGPQASGKRCGAVSSIIPPELAYARGSARAPTRPERPRLERSPALKLKLVCALVVLAGFATLFFPVIVRGQAEKTAPSAAHAVARPADIASRDAIVAALYDSISGPAGDRDWERFRSLFIPEAQLIAAYKAKDGKLTYKAMTVQGYIDGSAKYFKEHAFYEREISRKLETFGSITHIFSTYESRNAADGKPFERGINSIQLFNDGARWWIVDVYWTGETSENPIPDRYL